MDGQDGGGGVGQFALPVATAALSAASPRYGAPAAQALWSGMAVGQHQQETRRNFDAERRRRATFQDAIGNFTSDQYGSGKLSGDDARLLTLLNQNGDSEDALKLLEQYRNKPAREVLTPYDQAAAMAPPPPGGSLEVQTDHGKFRRETPFVTRPEKVDPIVHDWGYGQKMVIDPVTHEQRLVPVPTAPREPKAERVGRNIPTNDELTAIAAGEQIEAWPDWTPQRAQRVIEARAAGKGNPVDKQIAEIMGRSNKGPAAGKSKEPDKKADPLKIR